RGGGGGGVGTTTGSWRGGGCRGVRGGEGGGGAPHPGGGGGGGKTVAPRAAAPPGGGGGRPRRGRPGGGGGGAGGGAGGPTWRGGRGGGGGRHWEVPDGAGAGWFATVDELEAGGLTRGEPLAAAFDRLRAALAAARAFRDCGHPFVLAPVPTRAGEPVVRLADRFGLAVYPFVDGRSFRWGEVAGPAHREAGLGLGVAVHAAPEAVRRRARADALAVPHPGAVGGGLARGPA